ncbi:hypothetical protein ATO10_15010 [Actibacterium atlanticum]|uniref:Phasin domain-containing protein n=1 Tax=Actibacterium atlanticum TaxID=1461693 RepID=A0A058ZHY4_9RHOB|nr:phasin family protein [Actibacterium atlanticum]KCV80840.1 hypothetical protein ATO10_15010 [Actibacterium atlanticum]
MKAKEKAKQADFGGVSSMEGLDMAGRLSNAIMDFIGKSGAEFVEFVNARLQEDAKVQQALLSCQNVEDLSRVQADFVRTALEQYTEETGRMIRLSSAASQEILGAALKKSA